MLTLKKERNHRFLEEALELVQACNCSKEEAHALVDFVFDRPTGELHQEIGGVILTLSVLCSVWRLNWEKCAEIELERVWKNIDKIKEKQKTKPKIPTG